MPCQSWLAFIRDYQNKQKVIETRLKYSKRTFTIKAAQIVKLSIHRGKMSNMAGSFLVPYQPTWLRYTVDSAIMLPLQRSA